MLVCYAFVFCMYVFYNMNTVYLLIDWIHVRMHVFYLCVRTYSQKHSTTYAPSSCNYSERVHCLQRFIVARQEKSAVLHHRQEERHLRVWVWVW